MEEDIQKNDKNNRNGGKILRQCKGRGFHYEDKTMTEKCCPAYISRRDNKKKTLPNFAKNY